MIRSYGRLCILLLFMLTIGLILSSCTSVSRDAVSTIASPQTETAQSRAAETDITAAKAAKGREPRAYTAEELEGYPQDIRDILSRGKLRIGLKVEDRYPFFYTDEEGLLRGSDVELANDIALKLGVKPEYIRTADSFDEVIDQVSSGEVDVGISKLSITLERAKRVLFSNAYLHFKQALLINRLQLAELGKKNEFPDVLTLLQQRGTQIGIVQGTSYVGFTRELFPTQNQIAYKNTSELFDRVRQGEVIAAVYDAFEISRYLDQNPAYSLDLQYVQLEDQDDDIAIAVDPRRMHLHQWINTYLHMQEKNIQRWLENYGI